MQGNSRLNKSHPRIIAYGTIDEANASLGVVLTNKLDSDIVEILTQIQNDLFVVGSDLSNPDLIQSENRITSSMVTRLEKIIDDYERELPALTNFILPGGDISASQLHFTKNNCTKS